MGRAIDAIVLAGNRGSARNFSASNLPSDNLPSDNTSLQNTSLQNTSLQNTSLQNKAFLEINGEPLIQKIIDALQLVPLVDRIVIVGPDDRMGFLREQESVMTLEQGDTLYQNFWKGFAFLVWGDADVAMCEADANDRDKAVLVVPSDMPFPDPEEISEFLAACMARNLDYGVGMTDQSYLKRYLPTAERPGFEFQYLHLDDGSLRLNNLHYARPFRVENREYIERIYEFRYQKDLANIFGVAWDLMVRQGLGMAAVRTYLLLQLANLGHRTNSRWLSNWSRAGLTRHRITEIACRLLGGKTEIVETTKGNCAIDIDNQQDYLTLSLHYDEFEEDL
jgi:CTP:molybdopterin cytidylyltransferase MocA